PFSVDCPRARAGLDPEKGARARLERQTVAGALFRGDRCDAVFATACRSDLRGLGPDLAGSGPTHRKRPGAQRDIAIACSAAIEGRQSVAWKYDLETGATGLPRHAFRAVLQSAAVKTGTLVPGVSRPARDQGTGAVCGNAPAWFASRTGAALG